MKRSKVLVLVAVLLIIGATVATCYNMNKKSHPVSRVAECALRVDMRDLWTVHGTWTREVIIGLVDGGPVQDAVARLLNNQDDIGAAYKPYYDDTKCAQITKLLREHIKYAADVIVAVKYNNPDAIKKATDNWNKNAVEFSDYMSKINPYLDQADMRYMMNYHLKYTTTEVLSRIKKDYQQNIKDADKVHEELIEMADMLSMALVKQFPEKFICDDQKGDKKSGY